LVSSTGNEGTLHFYLNNYTDITSLRAAVRGIPYLGGNTNTTGGLRVMRTQIFNQAYGDRPDVPNVCILITDGVPTREVDGLSAEVQMDRTAQIRILGIGVTNQVSCIFI
jgi:Mg-chelatase subunit ChlD